MFKIIFTKKAIKSLQKIPQDYQIIIKNHVDKLKEDPFALDLKKLGDSYNATHRSRIGPYRLFLEIDTSLKIVVITEIERRTTQTYR